MFGEVAGERVAGFKQAGRDGFALKLDGFDRLGAAGVEPLEQALAAMAKIVGERAAGLGQPRRDRIAMETDGLRRLRAARSRRSSRLCPRRPKSSASAPLVSASRVETASPWRRVALSRPAASRPNRHGDEWPPPPGRRSRRAARAGSGRDGQNLRRARRWSRPAASRPHRHGDGWPPPPARRSHRGARAGSACAARILQKRAAGSASRSRPHRMERWPPPPARRSHRALNRLWPRWPNRRRARRCSASRVETASP